MDIKTEQEEITYSKTIKYFDLIATINGNDVEVGVEKWWVEGESKDEVDYYIMDREEVKKNFTEDEWEQLLDYIDKLK